MAVRKRARVSTTQIATGLLGGPSAGVVGDGVTTSSPSLWEGSPALWQPSPDLSRRR